MGKDAADEAVFFFVVLALVAFQDLTDLLCCGVFVTHYLKMKLTKDVVQSLWKVKYKKSYYTNSTQTTARAKESIDKNLNQNLRTRSSILMARF